VLSVKCTDTSPSDLDFVHIPSSPNMSVLAKTYVRNSHPKQGAVLMFLSDFWAELPA